MPSRRSDGTPPRKLPQQARASAPGRLTSAQETYCAQRAAGASQADAYAAAYPNASRNSRQALSTRGYTLETNTPGIKERIAALRDIAERESETSVARLRKELACIALFNVQKLVDQDGNPKRLGDVDEETARALSGIDVVAFGNSELGVGTVLKFRANSKIDAIKELLKLSGAYELDNKQKGQAQGEALADGLKGFLAGLSASGACGLPMAAPRQNTPEGQA